MIEVNGVIGSLYVGIMPMPPPREPEPEPESPLPRLAGKEDDDWARFFEREFPNFLFEVPLPLPARDFVLFLLNEFLLYLDEPEPRFDAPDVCLPGALVMEPASRVGCS